MAALGKVDLVPGVQTQIAGPLAGVLGALNVDEALEELLSAGGDCHIRGGGLVTDASEVGFYGVVAGGGSGEHRHSVLIDGGVHAYAPRGNVAVGYIPHVVAVVEVHGGDGAALIVHGLLAPEALGVAPDVEVAGVQNTDPVLVHLPEPRQTTQSVVVDGVVDVLVQDAPDNHAGVVPVPENHGRGLVVPAGQHGLVAHSGLVLQAYAQKPGSHTLVVDHKAQLVGQIKEVAAGHTPNETDAVEAHGFEAVDVAPGVFLGGGHDASHGALLADVVALKVYPLAVQAEGFAVEKELPEAAVGVVGVLGGGVVEVGLNPHRVEVGAFRAPEFGVVNLEGKLRFAVSRGGGGAFGNLVNHLTPGGGDCACDFALIHILAVVAEVHFHLHVAGMHVGNNVGVGYTHRGTFQKLHGVVETAVVVGGNLVDLKAFLFVGGGDENTAGQQVLAGFQRVGDVHGEHLFGGFVGRQLFAVQIDGYPPVRLPEAEVVADAGVGALGDAELFVVPRGSPVTGIDFRHDAGHPNGRSFAGNGRGPALFSADVFVVLGNEPVGAVEARYLRGLDGADNSEGKNYRGYEFLHGKPPECDTLMIQ